MPFLSDLVGKLIPARFGKVARLDAGRAAIRTQDAQGIVVPRTAYQKQVLTRDEFAAIALGRCPDCGTRLVSGPRAPGAVNVACPSCGSEFNVMVGVSTAMRNSDRGRPRKARLAQVFGIDVSKLVPMVAAPEEKRPRAESTT